MTEQQRAILNKAATDQALSFGRMLREITDGAFAGMKPEPIRENATTPSTPGNQER